MANPASIAILIYGEIGSTRNALAEEKYKDLCEALNKGGYKVNSVLYNDTIAESLSQNLLNYDAVLVWINPIEQGNSRKLLDAMLSKLAEKGCLVSTLPEVIIKMGTKDILFNTRDMDWGGDTEMYTEFDSFKESFPLNLSKQKIRVLKQYRGNGGNGVFKIKEESDGRISVTHAITGSKRKVYERDEFLEEFKPFFCDQGLLIDQDWNKNMVNGMVRCYVSGTKVAGFGYQEINALYSLDDDSEIIPPSKRYYYTEHCGIFSDLKKIMEDKWITELQRKLEIADNSMPIIWDADFFINSINDQTAVGKYTLCEINVSCVSPFPPSSIKFIVTELQKRLKKIQP